MEELAKIKKIMSENGIKYTVNEPLAAHTTIKIGGPAAVFCSPADEVQLSIVRRAANLYDIPCFLLGQGSNVLFEDRGYDGIIIQLSQAFDKIEIDGEVLRVQARTTLKQMCVAAQEAGLTGLEFAYGIPGGVGGAVYMNAGAYDGEMAQVLQSVRYMDEAGDVHSLEAEQLELGYRDSVFQHWPWCILSAQLGLQQGDPLAIRAKMEDYMDRRRARQPLEYPSAGSAFKRPEGAFAGRLIDSCGLRGYQVGGAAISQKHCGFIVNLGGATCADVLALAGHVVAVVQRETGYRLEKEIRVISDGR